MDEKNKIIIYTDDSGLTKIDVKLEDETLWLTQAQMWWNISNTYMRKANYRKWQLVGLSDRFAKKVAGW